MSYIRQDLIDTLAEKKDTLNYTKLIALLKELNQNQAEGNIYASHALLRAVIDHVPPIFGYLTFIEVVENHSWTKSDQRVMHKLLDFKVEADIALHKPISPDESDFLSLDDLPSPNRINTLLHHCIKHNYIAMHGQSTVLKKEQIKVAKQNGISISLIQEPIRWANYSVGRGVWSSFKIEIQIDNFKNKTPDYVSVKLEADLTDGRKWIADKFLYQIPDARYYRDKNQPFYIEPLKIKSVVVFISDESPPSDYKRPTMPNIDKSTFKLIVMCRSGANVEIPIPESLT